MFVASIFYGQAKPDPEDLENLARILDVDLTSLEVEYGPSFYPDKGRHIIYPPKDPLLYRLFEIIQVYGLQYKAVIHEKFGDGIMSAVCFSTKVEKEEDKDGIWVKITQRGKFLPFTKF